MPKKTDGGPLKDTRPTFEKDEIENIYPAPDLKCEVCKASAVVAVCDYTRLHEANGLVGYAMIGLPHYFCAEHVRNAIIQDA